MAKKVGSVYAEIRADIKKLQADFDKAHQVTQQSAKKIQSTIDNGINFSKVAAGAVAAAGSVYAAFRTISQVIESAKIGSVLEKQAQSFQNLSIAAGTSSRAMVDSLKQASQGLVAEADLMSAAGKAMLMSIPADKITELMKIAAATSKMTGQSITEAFSDITMGVARQSRMILDNLGIIVNVEKANEDYAKALGKTASSLTDAEQRQAFMNAVLKAGQDMINRLGSSSGALDGVNKLIAAQNDLWNEVNKTVASLLNDELAQYASMLEWINNKLKSMRASANDTKQSGMLKEIEMLRSLESKGLAQPGTTMNKMAEFNKRFGINSEAEIADKAAFVKAKAAEDAKFYGAQRVADNQIGYDVEARWKAYEEGLKKQAEFAKEAQAEVKKLTDEIKKLELEFEDSKIFGGENSQYERMQAQLRGGGELTQMVAERLDTENKLYADAAEKENARLMEKVAEYERTHKNLVNLTEETARAMQANFSGLFFDAMTGKLKTLEDYAKAVFDSIARMIADLGAQELTRGLFGPEMKGGGWLSTIGSMLGISGSMSVGAVGGPMTASQTAAASLPINTALYQPFHSGGLVGASGGSMRAIPGSYYNVPRLHNGLMPDEYPAILQRGERVIKRGGGASNNVTVNVSAPNGRMDRESLSTLQSGLFAALSRSNRRNG